MQAGSAGHALLIFEGCWRGQVGPYHGDWRELVDAGLDGGRYVAEHAAGAPIVSYAAAVLVLADEIERAEALIADIRADTRARGSIDAHLTALTWGALLAVRRGDLVQAEADARAVARDRHSLPGACGTKIWSAAYPGRGADRARRARRGRQGCWRRLPTDAVLGTAAVLQPPCSPGRACDVAQGRLAEAIDDLHAAERSLPPRQPQLRAVAIDARAGAGRANHPEQARELADTEMARARELGQPRGIGVALRASGILEGGDAAIAMLEKRRGRSCAALPAPGSSSRGRCATSAAPRRRAGNRAAAREPLREALDLAQRCGGGVARPAGARGVDGDRRPPAPRATLRS